MDKLQPILETICREIWQTMFRMELMPSHAHSSPSQRIWSRVSLVGAWTGHINLEVTPTLGRRICEAMLEIPEAEQTEEDVIDVMSELANIIGGNFKPHLGIPCALSLPMAGNNSSAPEVAATLTLAFEVEDEPFRVHLTDAMREAAK